MNNYVYLITDGKYVKIGQSEDPEKRLKCLQTGNAKPLRIIKKWSVTGRDNVFNRPVTNVQLEKNLQSCFIHKKSEGGNEWFKLNESEIHLLKHIKEFDDSFLGYETKFIAIKNKPIKTFTKDDGLHFLDKDVDEVDKLAFLLIKSNNTYLDLLSDNNYNSYSEREGAEKTNHFYCRFTNFLKKAQDDELKNILKLLKKENTECFKHIEKEEYSPISNQKLKSYYEDLFFLIRVIKDSTYKREIGNLKYAFSRSLRSFEKKYYEEGLVETKVIAQR